ALMGREESIFAETPAVGRVSEEQIEGFDVVGGTEIGGIAPEDTSTALQAERVDIFPKQAAALDTVLYEKHRLAAARQSLQPDRARAGEQVDHARSIEAFGIGMSQNIEKAFPRPVGRRPDLVRLRRRKGAAAKLP